MSRIIRKPDFACFSSAAFLNAIQSNAVQIRRSCIFLPLLTLAMPFCSSPLLAQQSDRSVLVFEGSKSSAGSNTQVELETELPQATGFRESEQTSATTQPFLPPSPPVSMNAGLTSSFRRPTQGTYTSATQNQASESQPELEPLRPTPDDEQIVQATSATQIAVDRGTFASRLPSDSGVQDNNSFGGSPPPANLRSNQSNSLARNRFGDFGQSPTPNSTSRFAPISSNQNSASEQNVTKPAHPQPSRFASSVVPASAQQPLEPTGSNNQFNTPTTSQRFQQPSPTSSATPPPSRLPASQPITTRPLTASPSSPRPTAPRPQANSHSFASPSESAQTGGFPSAPTRFSNSASSSSTSSSPQQPSSRHTNSFGGSNSSGAADLRALSSSNSGGNHSGASTPSERSTRPMIPRQKSSSSASSFPSSSTSRQSSSVGSRIAQQPLRGTPINNGNALRNNSSNTQTPTQRSTPKDQSSGKADRDSINFAKKQLQNLQPSSIVTKGTPVRLQEMFLEPLPVNLRKQMVAQYWETYYDLAALKVASDYEGWLDSISVSGAEKGLLNAAQQMASDQQLAARIQLGKSQSRLLDFMPNPRPNEFTPLPADQPLIEHYVTDYEKYKRVRSLPTSLRGIDPMLASTLKLITQRAATASSAKNAADQAGRSVRDQQVPLASALAAGRLWRDSQLDMIASTVSYNQAISDFVLTLEPNRSPQQLTAFMLGAPKNGSPPSASNPQNQPSRNATNLQSFPSRQLFR